MISGKPLAHIKFFVSLCILIIVIPFFFLQPAKAAPPVPAYDCSAQTSIPQIECEALVNLYQSTGGSTWTKNTEWLLNPDLCLWYGITCLGGTVTEVYLVDNNLVGSFPNLSNLSNLRFLAVSSNSLSGDFQTVISYIPTSLITIWLGDNLFSGTIPASLLNFTNLQEIEITFLNLSGDFPTIVSYLPTQLTSIWFGLNNFSGTIPSSLLNFSNLKNLNLTDNLLTGDLSIALNNLPKSINYLGLDKNNFSGSIPNSVSDFTALQYLYLADNSMLNGPIPMSITGLNSLDLFDIRNTGICEPQDASLQSWLSGLSAYNSSGINCQITCSAQTSVTEAECAALVALYNDTNGDSWVNNTNWLHSNDICSWYGVTCSGGSVTGLNLNGNNLNGSIPTAIGSLPNLTILNLSGNLLSGALPGEIGNIAPLITLNISGNAGLTGSLPANLTNLGALTSLNFSSTNLCEPQDSAFQTWLSGISVTGSGILCNIDCAVQTSVSQVECETLFSIYNATNGANWIIKTNWLKNLDVCTWNGVTCSGGAVSELNLTANNLVGSIPTTIDGLSNLILLNLSGNQLSGALPPEIGNITALEILDISHNMNLTGPLPASLTSLGALTNLDFGTTGLCEPQDSAFQTWLLGISVIDSGISCKIDCAQQTSVSQTECEALISLYNSTNGDSWTYRTNWLYNKNVCSWYGISCIGGTVTQIVLIYNNLTGSIPVEIGDFPNLISLGLGGSPISGNIPAEIGNLTSLNELVIVESNINGNLPASLGNLKSMQEMWIVTNKISGNIPAALGDLANLKTLALYNNKLTGSLPTKIGSLVNLEYLDLEGNTLSGSLPSQIGNLTTLLVLNITNNSFTGEIPGSFVNLTSLIAFLHANNELCLPNANTGLINWYKDLPTRSGIVYCDLVMVTHTPKPTTAGSGGSGTSPTSTSLPTNTPTITCTPTITATPTLVFPLQTLTQMAWEDTQTATAAGLSTATSQSTATLYYNQQQSYPPDSPSGDVSGAPSGNSSQSVGGGNTVVTGRTKSGGITKILISGMIIAALGAIVLFFLMKRRKQEDESTSYPKHKGGFQTFQ